MKTSTQIIYGPPPNYEELLVAFGDAARLERGAVFTYGDAIYSQDPMPDHLIKHEEVHMKQQKALGGPDIWWRQYIYDQEFRKQQEVEAYQAEYLYIVRTRPKHMHFTYLKFFADNFFKYYGLKLDIMEAMRLIKS